MLAPLGDQLASRLHLTGDFLQTRGGDPSGAVLGIARDHGLQQGPGFLNVTDVRVGLHLQGIQVCQVTLGVHHGLPGDAVHDPVQLHGQHGPPRLAELVQGPSGAVRGHRRSRRAHSRRPHARRPHAHRGMHAHGGVHAHWRGHTHGRPHAHRGPRAHRRVHAHRSPRAHRRAHARHRGGHAHRRVHAAWRSQAHRRPDAHGRPQAVRRPQAHRGPQAHRRAEACHRRARAAQRRRRAAHAAGVPAAHARQDGVGRRGEI
mmetsp:Transcript_32518/g.98303  ORF Transcript_32518/g.98303 Transcript_32518/m.98303 type:complete len:260 (+) Transcript_32518:1107-1886(+)